MHVEEVKQKIAVLCQTAFKDAIIDFDSIIRMGGLTNYNYKVKINGENFAVRFPGDGTEDMINRREEYISTKLANKLGIEPEIIYFNQENGTKIERYIENAITMCPDTVKQFHNLGLIAKLFRTLHNTSTDTGIVFNVFEMINGYENLIRKNNIFLYDDYLQLKEKVEQYKNEIEELHIQRVPCHNDPLCENFIYSNQKMYLIDWEYAGMNDPLWDIADVSIEANLNKVEEKFLLEEYLGCKADIQMQRRLQINKIFLDFLWTLWGKARSFYDPELEEYATKRYKRVKQNIMELENNF